MFRNLLRYFNRLMYSKMTNLRPFLVIQSWFQTLISDHQGVVNSYLFEINDIYSSNAAVSIAIKYI